MSHEIVKYRNEFVEAVYGLDTLPKKILIAICHAVQRSKPTSDGTYAITLNADAVCELIGVSPESKRLFEGAINSLMREIITIRSDGGNWKKSQILGESEYKDGVLTIQLWKTIHRYLIDVQEYFTAYKIANIRPLKSAYSIRIYELLKQYENTELQQREFEISELKDVLGCGDKYNTGSTAYKDFKTNVLLVAEKELKLKGTDIYFTWGMKKLGRKPHNIIFYIHKKEANHISMAKNEDVIPGLEPSEADESRARRYMEAEAVIRQRGWQGNYKEKIVKWCADLPEADRSEAAAYYILDVLSKDSEFRTNKMNPRIITTRLKDNIVKEWALKKYKEAQEAQKAEKMKLEAEAVRKRDEEYFRKTGMSN